MGSGRDWEFSIETSQDLVVKWAHEARQSFIAMCQLLLVGRKFVMKALDHLLLLSVSYQPLNVKIEVSEASLDAPASC